MKKLIAFGCFVLAFQSLSHVAAASDGLELQNGRKLLVRALAFIVNTEAYRKVPQRHICVPGLERPQE